MINVMILPIFKARINEFETKDIDVCKSIFGFDNN